MHDFTERQIQFREPATQHDKEPTSKVLPHSAPCFVLAPVGTVDYSLQQPRVHVQVWVLILSFSVTFLGFGSLNWLLTLSVFWICVVVLVFYYNAPAIGLARTFSYMGRKPVVSLKYHLSPAWHASFFYYSRPRTCRFPPSAVRRSSLPRFQNRPHHRL